MTHRVVMMENGKRRARRQLSAQEKWEIMVGSRLAGDLAGRDAARKSGVDVSVIVRLRTPAEDAAIAALTSATPGRPASAEAIELELFEPDRVPRRLGASTVPSQVAAVRSASAARFTSCRLAVIRSPTDSSGAITRPPAGHDLQQQPRLQPAGREHRGRDRTHDGSREAPARLDRNDLAEVAPSQRGTERFPDDRLGQVPQILR